MAINQSYYSELRYRESLSVAVSMLRVTLRRERSEISSFLIRRRDIELLQWLTYHAYFVQRLSHILDPDLLHWLLSSRAIPGFQGSIFNVRESHVGSESHGLQRSSRLRKSRHITLRAFAMRRNAAILGIIGNDLETARTPLPRRSHIDIIYFECAPSRSRENAGERSADRCGDRKRKPWSWSHPCPIFKREERVRLLRSDPNESYPLGPRRLPVSVPGGKGLRRNSEIAKLRRAFGPANTESTVISWPATIFTGRRVTDVRMQLVHLAKISIAMRAHKGRTKP